MMTLVDEHILAIGRGRSARDDPRRAERSPRPVRADESYLGARVVVEQLFVLRTLQQILERGPGRNAAEVLLDNGTERYFAVLWSCTAILGQRQADQPAAVGQPLTRRTEHSIQGNAGNPVCLRCLDIHNPQTKACVPGGVAGVHEREVPCIRGPGGEPYSWRGRQTLDGDLLAGGQHLQAECGHVTSATGAAGSRVEAQARQA